MIHPLRSFPRFSRVLFAAAVATVLVVASCGDDDDPYDPGNGGNGTNTVNVLASSFSPANLTISANETVTWQFNGGPHTVTQGTSPGNPATPEFDSGNRSSGTFTRTFDTPGTYQYFCAIHFGMGMTGTITVDPVSRTPEP